jgi:glycerol kinase
MSVEQARPRWILAIDQGTTNTKALLVGPDGQPAFRTAVPVSLSNPRADWVEQDALQLWEGVVEVLERCLSWTGQQRGAIAGIAISNQRETAVSWERATGKPVRPAILWQCRRSARICERLRAAGCESLLRERTGLRIDPLFSAGKMQWLLEEVDGLRSKADTGQVCFGTVDSWLIWNLTSGAVHACDVSNASRTQLLNLQTAEWDDELLGLFEVPRAALPKVLPSSGRFGDCAGIEGLSGVPIVSAMGDSHAAMAGHASFLPGTVKATYGTGSSLMTLLPALPGKGGKSQLATTIAWAVGGASQTKQVQYALEGNISMAGSALQWVGEFLGLAEPVREALELAATVDDSDGVYFVPAMVGLGAPHWDSEARGTISGLTRTSRAAHLCRAALEAIAFQVRDVFNAMEVEAGCTLPALYADGGATRNEWLMQFQADVLGRPVVRSGCEDLSALGAAWFGGLALGWWRSTDELAAIQPETQTFTPRMPEQERERRYVGWKLAVARARLAEDRQ